MITANATKNQIKPTVNPMKVKAAEIIKQKSREGYIKVPFLNFFNEKFIWKLTMVDCYMLSVLCFFVILISISCIIIDIQDVVHRIESQQELGDGLEQLLDALDTAEYVICAL